MLSGTVGVTWTLVAIVVFFMLLLMFAYFLFRVSYFGIVIFSVLLIGELIVGGMILHRVVGEQVHNYLSQLVGQTTNIIKVEVNSRLQARIYALNSLAQSIHQSNISPEDELWQNDAASIMQYYPGLQAIEWVGDDYTVKWAVPLEGNEMMDGNSNVIVTDGFTGNIALKTAEGTAKYITNNLKKSLTKNFFSKISLLFSYFSLGQGFWAPLG